jgi:predicted amidophosphoribosyltransferase
VDALRPLLSIVVPPRCLGCADACEAGEPLCWRCRARLDRTSPPPPIPLPDIDVAWAAAPHHGIARNLVAALKFRGLLPAAELIAVRIALLAPPELLEGIVVPVPPAPARLLRRGLDPAEEIARRLVSGAGMSMARCLTRAGGPRQVGRSRSARLDDPPRVQSTSRAPAAVVLVDDVQTTGATLRACAAALRAAGAQRVVALTFARSL